MIVVHLGGAFEQPAVQVEYVSGVCLASGRSAQQQRHLAVRPCVLGEVVVDDERVFALIHEVLGHGATSVWSEILHGRGVGGVGGDYDGVFHGAVRVEQADGLRYLASLLAYGDVDAD